LAKYLKAVAAELERTAAILASPELDALDFFDEETGDVCTDLKVFSQRIVDTHRKKPEIDAAAATRERKNPEIKG